MTQTQEEKLATRKVWRDKNRNRIKAYKKAWYEKNKNLIKQRDKTYYEENIDKIKAYKKEWAQKNRTYLSWKSMRRRCENPKDSAYHDYGGRGIKVCERWATFEHFLADMGECPNNLEIERINNNGNYKPGNCKWATRKEQANNKRSNTLLVYNGKSQTIAQWADELGIIYETLCSRIYRSKWSIEKALTTP